MLALVGPSVAIATNATKAINALRSLQEVSEEGALLWHLLDAIEAPLRIASNFLCREDTMMFFEGSVQLSRSAIAECERLLARDDDEDGRPSSQEGWMAWLDHKKQGLKRREALPKLTARLQVCINALQLSYTSMAAVVRPPESDPMMAAFSYSGTAVHRAREIVHQFEMARRRELLLCVGNYITSAPSAVASRCGQEDWRTFGMHSLWLQLDDHDSYQLLFRKAAKIPGLEDSEEEGDSQTDIRKRLRLGNDLKVQRKWTRDVSDALQLQECQLLPQIAYFFSESEASHSSSVILFEVPNRKALESSDMSRPLSVEVFEALLVMLMLTAGLEDGRHLLADSCDVDSATGKSQFVFSLEQLMGPY